VWVFSLVYNHCLIKMCRFVNHGNRIHALPYIGPSRESPNSVQCSSRTPQLYFLPRELCAGLQWPRRVQDLARARCPPQWVATFACLLEGASRGSEPSCSAQTNLSLSLTGTVVHGKTGEWPSQDNQAWTARYLWCVLQPGCCASR